MEPLYQPLLSCEGTCLQGPTRHAFAGRQVAPGGRRLVFVCSGCGGPRTWGFEDAFGVPLEPEAEAVPL
jgi:hypothetical protein